jgi:hypothetical protein
MAVASSAVARCDTYCVIWRTYCMSCGVGGEDKGWHCWNVLHATRRSVDSSLILIDQLRLP